MVEKYMARPPECSNRLAFLTVLALLAILLLAACRPTPQSAGPDIQDIVATSMLGTRQAWVIGTIVSATNAA